MLGSDIACETYCAQLKKIRDRSLTGVFFIKKKSDYV